MSCKSHDIHLSILFNWALSKQKKMFDFVQLGSIQAKKKFDFVWLVVRGLTNLTPSQPFLTQLLCTIPWKKVRPVHTMPRWTLKLWCYSNSYSQRHLTLHNSARSTCSHRPDCYPRPWISSNTHFEEPCRSRSDALCSSRQPYNAMYLLLCWF